MRWILAAALAAFATSAAAQDNEPEFKPEPGQEKLVMLSGPGPKDDAKIFPKGAPVSGTVHLRCTLTAKGTPTDCSLVREDPPGGGLLAAAMQEASLFRYKPLDRDGKPVEGRKVVVGQSYLAAGDKNPDWLQKPTPNDLASVFPVRAMREGKDGSAAISCRITIEGYLDRCSVVSETPSGYAFGEAALILSKQFRMTPKIRGGKPVEGAVRIPINWSGFRSARGEMAPERLIANPVWAKTPSRASVVAAYPAKAVDAPSGQAVVRCSVDKTGKPINCSVTSEIPDGKGFGAAAKSLAPQFQMAFRPEDEKQLRSLQIDIPFRFRNPTVQDTGRLTEPTWTQTLSEKGAELLFPKLAVEKQIKTGLGVVDCTATAAGGLGDCRVAREDPVGFGFGAAALDAAKVMQMNPWTKTGDAVEGRRLLLPIRLSVKEFVEDPPSAAAGASAPAP